MNVTSSVGFRVEVLSCKDKLDFVGALSYINLRAPLLKNVHQKEGVWDPKLQLVQLTPQGQPKKPRS